MKIRIGGLAIAGVAAVLLVALGLMTVLVVGAHRAALHAQLVRSADQLAETIARSTHFDMLENRRASLHREIVTLGEQPGVDKVRLFNATGTIMFSSDEAEIGHSVDKNGEACYGCHAAGAPLHRLPQGARARNYRAPDGHPVLGMIRPIHNEESCWNAACHAHPRSDAVLGVLDVDLSLVEMDRRVAADQRRIVLIALLTVAACSALLWWWSRRLIFRPVAELIAGARQVAEGDLNTTIPATAQHELGDLARAFNDMVRRLGEAQVQLTQADKLASVGRLAAGVAHEINNPLTGVLTYASFLRKRVADDSDEARDLDVIVRETKRCREIVRGLLDFARGTPPRRSPTDLNEVVRRSVAIVMNQLNLHHVGLQLDLAGTLGTISADANQLQQVLVNLIINAADAIGDGGGTIHVRTRGVALPARGQVAIRSAKCPRGCDLMSPNVRIGGRPAIRTTRRFADRDALVHLDPVYGRANHRASEPCEAGTVPAYLCPRCRTPLELPDRRCGDCGSPVFAVESGAGGRVEWCARKGCHWTRWEAMDAQPPQPFVEFDVEDTGRGIADEDREHLFEPFFTTKGNRGLGLGLAVSWGIVEGHGGSIEVRSEPGRGTCFTVRLPKGADAPALVEGDRGAARTGTTPAGSPAAAPAAPDHERGAA